MPHRLIGDIDVAAVRIARLGHTQIGHGGPQSRRSITLTSLADQTCGGLVDATQGLFRVKRLQAAFGDAAVQIRNGPKADLIPML